MRDSTMRLKKPREIADMSQQKLASVTAVETPDGLSLNSPNQNLPH